MIGLLDGDFGMIYTEDRQKILLVHTPCSQIEEDNLEPPLGLLQIAAVIRQNGYLVEILDLSSHSLRDCYKQLNSRCHSFDYVGFSTYTSTYYVTLKLLHFVKGRNNSIVTIAGGPHATALSEDVSKDFDYVVGGEGEASVLEVLKGTANKIIHSEPIQNLDLLPFPAYDLIDLNNYTRLVDGNQSLSILSSRGCPNRCAFCNSIIFSKNSLRLRSPENVASEINLLYLKYGIKNFRFQDDLFTIDPERIGKIFELIPKISYRCFARADTLTEKMCNILLETGCKHVSVGVESGSDKILKLMDKGITSIAIHEGLSNAKNVGLIIRIYLIVGFPGETEKTIEETIKFLKNLPFDEFVVYPLIPYPGTKISNEPEKFGITFIDKNYDKYIQVGKKRFTGFVFKTNEFDGEDIRRWRKKIMTFLEDELEKSWSSTKSKFK